MPTTKSLFPTEDKQVQEAVRSMIDCIHVIAAARDDFNQSALEAYWTMGDNIRALPAYQKGKHGQGEFFQRITDIANAESKISVSPAYASGAVKFAEMYPKFQTALETFKEKQVSPAIRNIPKLAGEEKEQKVKDTCRHCKEHCPHEE